MDYYQQDPSRLNGQPKRTIGDYVEKQGILVPKRFDSIADALSYTDNPFFRSEHEQEYNGVSGLLDSFRMHNEKIEISPSTNLKTLAQEYFKQEELTKDKEEIQYLKFCKLQDINIDEFKSQTSFSTWEYIEGYNRTIVADSAIAQRYHIMTKIAPRVNNYIIFEKGKIHAEFGKPLPDNLRSGLQELIQTYERIRNLKKFNSNHCPILEFQTAHHNEKNYFLQYHRTRDFNPATFTLEREMISGELEVPFVRGCTTPEGRIVKTTVYYNYEKEPIDTENEGGSFDLTITGIFSEIQCKKRELQMITDEQLEFALESVANKHTSRSKMFKPEISIICPIDIFLKKNEILFSYSGRDKREYHPRPPQLKRGQRTFDFSKNSRNGHNSYMMLHVVADGRRALIQRVD